MNSAYLCLGSNLGDRSALLQAAVEELSSKCTILAKSSLYETEPVAYVPQDWFLNQVIEIKTKLSVHELLDFCLETEIKLGRKREDIKGEPGEIVPEMGRHIKHAQPRKIDIDIVLFNDEIIREANLEIPHPRMHARRFVLEPLCEIAPNLVHPVLGKKMKELLEEITSEKEVRKLL